MQGKLETSSEEPPLFNYAAGPIKDYIVVCKESPKIDDVKAAGLKQETPVPILQPIAIERGSSEGAGTRA